jgi:outer membrane protein TolC
MRAPSRRNSLAIALVLLAVPAAAEAPLRTVGWQEALEQALARNPSVVVAHKEIARAGALVREARAGWLPQLGAGGTLTRIDSSRVLNNMVVTPANQQAGNVQATIPLLAPQAWANDWHAQDNRDVVTLTAADVNRQVAAAVARAYLTIILQHRQVEVAARALETARAHYQYAHTRLSGGLGNSIDDARAEQEARTDEAQLASSRAALIRAQSALAILLSEDRLVDVQPEVQLPEPPAPEAAEGEARGKRSDILVARQRLVASKHLRRDTWVYYAPTLAAVAQTFLGTRTAVQPDKGWQAQLVLNIPLFDGGFRYGVARERRALEEEAQVQLDATLRQVTVEVRAAFETLRQADDSLRAAQAAARAATTAASLATQAYQAGATSNLELIDAERRARDAASQAAIAEDAARQARLDLLLASGRFP